MVVVGEIEECSVKEAMLKYKRVLFHLCCRTISIFLTLHTGLNII